MERRRLMFMGLASALTATLGLAATAQAATVGDTSGLGRSPIPTADAEGLFARQPAEEVTEGVQLAQYHSSGRHRRGPRCWNETRNVRYRDRFGRLQTRQVTRRVCR